MSQVIEKEWCNLLNDASRCGSLGVEPPQKLERISSQQCDHMLGDRSSLSESLLHPQPSQDLAGTRITPSHKNIGTVIPVSCHRL